MRKLTIAILCTAAFIFTIYSCDNLLNSTGGGISTPNSSSGLIGRSNNVGLTDNAGMDLKAVSRFKANIHFKGTFKPGEPIQVIVNTQAKLPTEQANVRLFLPEIHALKLQKTGQPVKVPAKQLPPQALWNRLLSKDRVLPRKKRLPLNNQVTIMCS